MTEQAVIFKASLKVRIAKDQVFSDCEIEVSATSLEELFKLIDQALELAVSRSPKAQTGSVSIH